MVKWPRSPSKLKAELQFKPRSIWLNVLRWSLMSCEFLEYKIQLDMIFPSSDLSSLSLPFHWNQLHTVLLCLSLLLTLYLLEKQVSQVLLPILPAPMVVPSSSQGHHSMGRLKRKCCGEVKCFLGFSFLKWAFKQVCSMPGQSEIGFRANPAFTTHTVSSRTILASEPILL